MGYVYKARDELIDETVALKFLHPNLLNAPKAGQLFIKEAQLVRRLRHDNIIAVHDIDWTDEVFLFFSMEYLEGQSLRQMLRKYRIENQFLPNTNCSAIYFADIAGSRICTPLGYS